MPAPLTGIPNWQCNCCCPSQIRTYSDRKLRYFWDRIEFCKARKKINEQELLLFPRLPRQSRKSAGKQDWLENTTGWKLTNSDRLSVCSSHDSHFSVAVVSSRHPSRISGQWTTQAFSSVSSWLVLFSTTLLFSIFRWVLPSCDHSKKESDKWLFPVTLSNICISFKIFRK